VLFFQKITRKNELPHQQTVLHITVRYL
jgi:hypothetical protein